MAKMMLTLKTIYTNPVLMSKFLSLILLVIPSSCVDTNPIIEVNTLYSIEEIKKYLEFQERVESEEKEFENPYKLTEKDLFLAMSLENESLIKNGFKSLDKSAFEEKILKIINHCCPTKIT